MKYISKIVFIVYILIMCSSCARQKEEMPVKMQEIESIEESIVKTPLQVMQLDFVRVSTEELKLIWPDSLDENVAEYEVLRQDMTEGIWETVGVLNSDGSRDDQDIVFTDFVGMERLQRFRYRIDVHVVDETKYEARSGKECVATNILICLDPGHYGEQNAIYSKVASYSEGKFTLELGKELKNVLKEEYGITSILTRESDHIEIQGYQDRYLDHGNISLRGKSAKGADLFLSLHTNANLEHANGKPTTEQPISLTKPIVLINAVGMKSTWVLSLASEIGAELAKASFESHFATVGTFRMVNTKEEVKTWTDEYNDRLDVEGTVCNRLYRGDDYYGVLRGASSVGVPGMIIEHGHHTVPEMRKLASTGVLAKIWACADARGIARGFGIR